MKMAKINFWTVMRYSMNLCGILILMMVAFTIAKAQQYSHKYVGLYDTQSSTISPLKDPLNWTEIDFDIKNWQDCQAKGTGWEWMGYAVSGDPTPFCRIIRTGNGTSVPQGALFGEALSRRYYIYKAREIGLYHMEITGISIYSNGISRTNGDATDATKYAGNSVAWRQVPTSNVAAEWHWPQTATMAQTKINNWLELDVTPKYQLLCNEDWDVSKIIAGDNNSVNYNVDNNKGAWVDLPMQSPIVFNPDSNLELVFVQDSFEIWGGDANPGFENNISGWEYKDPDGDMCTRYRSGQSSLTYTLCQRGFFGGGYTCYNSDMKPHLRLRYRNLTCENVQPAISHSIYRTADTIPISDMSVSFEMRYAPRNSTHLLRYAIVGPLPLTDTVYQTSAIEVTDASAGDDPLRLYHSVLSDFTGVSAVGLGVASDGRSVDCFKLEPGRYSLIAVVETQLADFYPRVGHAEFSISAGQDLVAYNVESPRHMQQFSGENASPIRVLAEVHNNSLPSTPSVDNFHVQAVLYRATYDPLSETAVRGVAVDTLPHKTADNSTGVYHWTAAGSNGGQPLASGEIAHIYDNFLGAGFDPTTLPVGYYDIEFKVWSDSAGWDLGPTNNVYPRSGKHHIFRIQREYDVTLAREQILPAANTVTNLGQTIYVETGVRNDGLLDLSDRSGYYLDTKIYKYSTVGGKGALMWAPVPYVIRSGTEGEGYVTVPCVNDLTLAPVGWLVSDTGQYIVETQLLRSNNYIPPTFTPVAGQLSTRIFTVEKGLAGTYSISVRPGSDYNTIKSAVDALYKNGVSGDVRFELSDAEYTERSWDVGHNEYPALDFRGRIPGVYDVIHPTPSTTAPRIRTITFAPGGVLANQRGSIRINLESKSGYGMLFGAADSAVAHTAALINDVPQWEKSRWYQSDGYITWDGGVNKSFRFSLRAPTGADYSVNDPIAYFRAPIYMSNARNITISNCIIEENRSALSPSEYFLLPGNSYNGSELRWDYDYERSGSVTKSYSAGIVLRSVPPYQARYGSNYYNFETLPCTDITLIGNDISSFSYGIASIGLDYRNGVAEYLIDVIDTLRDLTLQDLMNPQQYIDCLTRLEYTGVPLGGSTTVSWFRERTSSIERGIRYYKHHAVRQSNGSVSEFVQVVDSANGGVARIFNRNTLIENNLIHNIGRAGIFLGNDENTIIRGNMITGITGNLVDASGVRVAGVDVAGILLGGNQRTHVTETTLTNGYMVVGTEIYKNEISNLAGTGSIYGIKLEQVPVTERISSFNIKFPDRPERLKIYSNIIWGLSSRGAHTSRYGINLSLSKRAVLFGESLPVAENMYYSTADATHFLDDILLANNTIVLDEDGYYDSDGDYFGLRLQRIKNARVVNNAIELEDSTQLFTSTNTNNFAAMIYYQGPNPSELNNLIDYNAYGNRATNGSEVDIYCHALTNTGGGMIDVAHRSEYRTLSNWQNWIGTDLYSVVKSFSGDLQQLGTEYPKLRFRTNTVLSNSPLDKRGTYITEAEVDIDGVNRTLTNQNLDIGAQYVNSTKLAYDAEVLNISAPATYKAAIGPLSDAEYFMVDNSPLRVKVIVRNNGSSVLQNKRITLRIYEESPVLNNTVASTHTTNYSSTYYNNERALYNERYNFPDINPSNAGLFWSGSQNVTLATGENVELEFQLDKTFNSYYHLNNYSIPRQFAAMAPNVTPRYLFEVAADSTGDLDWSNNTFSKHARFYVKRSKNDMLVSAVNTYHQMQVQQPDAAGKPVLVPNSSIDNVDWVAGKLNLDTLQQGFSRLRLQQVDNEAQSFDYDVIDRHAWDYRNIDYTLYKTLYIADELGKDEGRWARNRYDNTLRLFREQYYAQNLVDFLTSATATSKKNLIVASENFVSDIYKSLLQTGSLWILNNKAQRDAFLYNDAARLEFLNSELQIASLRDSLNKILVRDYFRANVVFDSLSENGPYIWNGTEYNYEYLPVAPLYTKAEITGGELIEQKWGFQPSPYKFQSKVGTITGSTLNTGYAFEIKPTGWGWVKDIAVEDAQPFGSVLRPVDNMLGNLTIGAVYDTVTNNPELSSNPQTGKAAALCVSTVRNNVVLLGFDWRHFANIEVLLDDIMGYIVKNGGDDNDASLPISFYGFDANAIRNRVEVEWNTTSGSVISMFEVEKAEIVNNKIGQFKNIDNIKAKENHNNNFYNTTDRNLEFGSTVAYRLKLIDDDGNFVYTENKIVKIEEAQFAISDITPNPVTAISEFTVENSKEQSLHIAVYDLAGKEMMLLNNGIMPSGSFKFVINSKLLPQTTYTLTIRGEQLTINKQFSVIK